MTRVKQLLSIVLLGASLAGGARVVQAAEPKFEAQATDARQIVEQALALGAADCVEKVRFVPQLRAMVGALVFRRHSPMLTFGLVTIFGIAHLSTLNRPTFSLVAVPIVAYAVARWVPGLITRSVLVVGAVAAVIGPYRWFWDLGGYLEESPREGMLFFTFACLCFGAVATPYIIGRRVAEGADARERELETERELYARAAVEREQQARLAEASTRAQIARELHDVVAHSLSIIIVQAEGGRALARKSPDAAGAALGAHGPARHQLRGVRG